MIRGNRVTHTLEFMSFRFREDTEMNGGVSWACASKWLGYQNCNDTFTMLRLGD